MNNIAFKLYKSILHFHIILKGGKKSTCNKVSTTTGNKDGYVKLGNNNKMVKSIFHYILNLWNLHLFRDIEMYISNR